MIPKSRGMNICIGKESFGDVNVNYEVRMAYATSKIQILLKLCKKVTT